MGPSSGGKEAKPRCDSRCLGCEVLTRSVRTTLAGRRGIRMARDYVLGQSTDAARRLEIQDAHFGDISERLLDDLALRPTDRVVELGCGPGGFSRRILRRLGERGVLVAIDRTQGLLDQ